MIQICHLGGRLDVWAFSLSLFFFYSRPTHHANTLISEDSFFLDNHFLGIWYFLFVISHSRNGNRFNGTSCELFAHVRPHISHVYDPSQSLIVCVPWHIKELHDCQIHHILFMFAVQGKSELHGLLFTFLFSCLRLAFSSVLPAPSLNSKNSSREMEQELSRYNTDQTFRHFWKRKKMNGKLCKLCHFYLRCLVGMKKWDI